ncbi:hypothetical protein CN154_15035 [Sinorhizobium meliloti]|uniref:hypothetical protein n=1 Tax=Rhizobium meliloti TaxID=382 RepID=UPI000FD80FDD|nr:hypothetical protein [Sinorhizobium meliloti]RVK75416.1 hypothetical protein CN154_15035 [Sinorhizobium meliloti]
MKWLTGGIGAIVGATLMVLPACMYGQRIERHAAAVEAGKNALQRIQQLEKSNANFSKLSDRDRCLVFMRDSGLPDSACD